MYTSTFYATATGVPSPPFETPFDDNKLPVEYAKSVFLLKVQLSMVLNVEKTRGDSSYGRLVESNHQIESYG